MERLVERSPVRGQAVVALTESPSAESLEAARSAWLAARAAYLDTEAFLFYAGPVDGPGGPFPRLNMWPVDPASIAVAPEEYPVLLKRVYKDEKFPKPRNAVGLTKDLPVEEMEKLMITNAQVSDDDMVGLGNQRAQVVKDWLLKNGGVAQDRVFLLAAKVGGSPAKAGATEEGKEAKPESGKAKASRVDFSLK